MKIPIEWLKEFVPVKLSAQKLAERLTMTGTEVSAILSENGQDILDLEVTPNRADCLSILGVAREVAVITGQRLKLLKRGRSSTQDSGKAKQSALKITIEDKKGCSRYIGRLIEGVTVRPSPNWMQRRLLACGTRPINNLVDSTNYVLYELGQPLHAFDFAKLSKGILCVRGANPKETITTLDGATHILSPDMVVIADANRAVAVAGVMGGVGSEVTEDTKTILLESALFDPMRVRQTARRLGLASESSYRFERGVDPEGVSIASERAAQLIMELAGGHVVQTFDIGEKRSARVFITVDSRHLNGWLGTRHSPNAIRTTLAKLSCRVAASGESAILRVSPPSFRRDLVQPVDFYEEIARLSGYEAVDATVPSASLTDTGNPDYCKRMQLRRICAGLGLTEVVNWSLISERDLARVRFPAKDAVPLTNPLSQDHAWLRPTLLVGLLSTVRRNLNRGASSVRIFELGAITEKANSGSQKFALGIALSGLWAQDWRVTQPAEFFHLKGILESLGRRFGASFRMVRQDVSWSKPGEAVQIFLGDSAIGVAGLLASSIGKSLDLEQPVWCAQIFIEPVLKASVRREAIRAPVAYPPVKRDLSIVLKDAISFGEVERTIRDTAKGLGYQIKLIDRYTGKPIPSGKHSLTFSIEYRDATRTLTAIEADRLHQQVGEALTTHFGASLR